MTAPAGIYRIDGIGAGTLAIMAHPASGGDAAARIAEIAASGVNQVISLLEPAEAQLLGLQHEAELVNAAGMEFISFPVPDLAQPASVAEFARLTRRLYQRVHAGSNALIHCRAGVGRSGLLASAVLMHGGRDAHQAFAHVARRRGMPLPETSGQGAWLETNRSAITACAPG